MEILKQRRFTFICRREAGRAHAVPGFAPIGRLLLLALAAGAIPGWAAKASDPGVLERVNYGRDILPILSKNCFHCHGPDEGTREAKLRLDTREGILGKREGSGAIVAPGKPTESELILRITSPHGDEMMPPPESKKSLTSAQIALLKRWVTEGAEWGKHWSYEAVRSPAIPAVRDRSELLNPIDNFVRERLEREKVAPSPAADRRTLFRRLSLDLLGLPPEPEAVQAFVEDKGTDAYERAVDLLLSSPHFGERWGRHWLDLARYADSGGYLNDTLRPYAYLYRDWVIESINQDQPFDRFTVEQLAGDLLPGATLAQKIATGFHRNTLTNGEAGSDLEFDRCKIAVDRTATTGAVWLGLTVGCAECHTHKYDQITQREFYQLYAFFNTTAEREVPAPQPDELAEYTRRLGSWESERAKIEAPFQAYVATLPDPQVRQWEGALEVPSARWSVLKPNHVAMITEDDERDIAPIADHSILPGARAPFRCRYIIKAPLELARVSGFRIEAIADFGKKVGRSRTGEFALAEFSVVAHTPDGGQRKLEFASARATYSAKDGPAAMAIDGDIKTSWSIAPQTDSSHVIVFELKAPESFPPGTILYCEMQHRIIGLMSRFRLSATGSGSPLAPSIIPDSIFSILDTPLSQRSASQRLDLASYLAGKMDGHGRELAAKISAHLALKPEFPKTVAPILVTDERETHIHLRGDYKQRGDRMSPGTLAVLHPFKPRGEQPDRLDLAHWVVDPENPLTARVTANHIWKHLFGRGLVATPDNFGAQGEPPSHPELLDYLAAEFIRHGWSRKKLIRLIVTSATYRQASIVRPDLLEHDPYNILLARQSRHRLEAEVVRDVFLAQSGLLNRKIGGPSVYPPLPPFVMAFGRDRTWPATAGPAKNRRGLYVHLRRNVPYPMLIAFDAPDASAACLQRERSNTPLQALTLLNDPVFFECVQHFGKQLAGEPGSVEQRLQRGFTHVLGRPATPREMEAMRSFYDDSLKLNGGDAEFAMIAVARVMMNLDEFITRE